MSIAALELDLDVFSGPFDLLLTLVLREEVDLLELSLADVVLAYLDHLEQRGELDLETATEFIVLVAALLELKSRLMLTGDEEELLDIEPEQAAEELLARMLDARRFRAAATHLGKLLGAEEGVRFREAPLPPALRRSITPGARRLAGTRGARRGDRASAADAAADQRAPHRHRSASRVAERLVILRGLLRRGTFSFDDAVKGADRMTIAVTLFALLELYKRGEASWVQQESFGEISVSAAAAGRPQNPAAEPGRAVRALAG